MDGPESVFDNETFHKRLGSLAFAAILLTLLTVWMIELKSIFQPFFIALGIYFVLKPGADYLSKNGFPIYLSYLTMLLSAFLVIIAAGYLAFDQVSDLADDEDRIKQYNRQLDNRWNQLKGTPMIGSSIAESLNSTNGTFTEDLAEMGLLSDDSGIGDAIGGVVSSVGSLLGMGLTVTFFLIFIIFEANFLPGRIERAWPGGVSGRVQDMQIQIQESINTYVIVKTGVGLGTAGITGLVLFIFGIDLWFTWALLTFILNYVPYIGSLIATIPPLILGFVTLSPVTWFVLLILLVTNQQLWGSIIETKWAGRALDISPVLLLLTTAYSYWVWGILGMVLVVPFTVIFKIVLENIEPTRPIAILLAERAPSIDEAWRDAMKDGRISSHESRSLEEIQKILGLSDRQVTRVAAKHAIERSLKRNRMTTEQFDYIMEAASLMDNDAYFLQLNNIDVESGRLKKSNRTVLESLYVHLEEE
ncbi:MAG: AI-2E family transporter [Candidatus Thermoplasmatota archaeon]|nr:AI-2E family transporter [Candidatus Thermoplasmatota archaeon]MEC7254189.1 AI-2E family transporter [Candidatus Thermoplasmatota archaeon]MEC8609678.1 AI-2E family transporter [Candidatus Thermoplasmatota archaeon]